MGAEEHDSSAPVWAQWRYWNDQEIGEIIERANTETWAFGAACGLVPPPEIDESKHYSADYMQVVYGPPPELNS